MVNVLLIPKPTSVDGGGEACLWEDSFDGVFPGTDWLGETGEWSIISNKLVCTAATTASYVWKSVGGGCSENFTSVVFDVLAVEGSV